MTDQICHLKSVTSISYLFDLLFIISGTILRSAICNYLSFVNAAILSLTSISIKIENNEIR